MPAPGVSRDCSRRSAISCARASGACSPTSSASTPLSASTKAACPTASRSAICSPMAAMATAFRDRHLLPMAAAIWSGSFRSLLDFPAAGFLALLPQPRPAATAPPAAMADRGGPQPRLCAAARRRHRRHPPGRRDRGHPAPRRRGRSRDARRQPRALRSLHRRHSCATTALALLGDADAGRTPSARRVPFQPNRAILHRDAALMPKRRACWASWNYIADAPGIARRRSSLPTG